MKRTVKLVSWLWIAGLVFPGSSGNTRAEEEAVAVDAVEAPAAEMDLEPAPGGYSPPGVVTPWGRFGEDYAEGLLDVLLPLYFDQEGGTLFYTDLRMAYSDVSEQELNVGFGVRQLVDRYEMILGANVFYDSRWTEENSQFNQLGVGVELLSNWFDARANGYFPENRKEQIGSAEETILTGTTRSTTTQGFASGHSIYEKQTTRTVNSYVQNSFVFYDVPLEGMDAEIGVRIPMPVAWLEARLFGGYYAFQPVWEGDAKGVNEIEGFKGRAELRIHQNFLLDAEVFEDDRLFGSDYLVSARVRLPFDIGAICRGENPFRDEPVETSGIRSRFSEMVMRDPHIQIRRETTVTSETVEETTFTTNTAPVLENVIFVDGDNAGDVAENGTAEHPFDVIQEGVDTSAAREFPHVYVFSADNPYTENVLVSSNINLYGGTIPLNNGGTFGDGTAPIVKSAGAAPFLFTFDGMEFARLSGFQLDGSGAVPVLGGALFENVRNVEVTRNEFRDLPIGVAGMMDDPLPAEGYVMNVEENTFVRNGIAVGGVTAVSGDFNVINNTIQDSLLGVGVIGTGLRSQVLVDGNQITYEMPLDILSFEVVDSLLEDFLPGPLPEELPLPMVGGVLVAAVNGKLTADITNNSIQGPLLGITGLSLNLGAPRSDLDLVVANNSVQGGGLIDTLNLVFDNGLLGGLLPPPSGDLDALPFDGGLSGITLLSLGDGARINDALIAGNEVRENMLGITVVAAGGGRARRADVVENTLIDNSLGITGLGLLEGDLNDLNIIGNTIQGGGLQNLIPLIEVFTGPIPLELPPFSLAGITLVGFGDASMKDIVVAENTLSDHVLGITALGISGADFRNLLIEENTLTDNALGITALGIYGANFNDLEIHNNTVNGGGLQSLVPLIELLTGPLPFDVPSFSLAGITVAGLESEMKNVWITDNTVAGHALGISALGLSDANLKNMWIAGNTLEDNFSGVLLLGAGPGVNMSDALIEDNTITGAGTAFVADILGALFSEEIDFPDLGLAGVSVVGLSGAKLNDFTVSENEISDQLIGVLALGYGDATLRRGNVNNNTIEYGVAGIAGVSLYGSNLNDLLITNNTLTGFGIDLDGGLPLGPVTLFSEKALVGVGILAVDGKAKDAVIAGNDISNNDIGIAVVEESGGNTNGFLTPGNSFTNNTEDVLVSP